MKVINVVSCVGYIKKIYKKVGVLLIRLRIVKSNVSSVGLSSEDEGSTSSLTNYLARNIRLYY